MTELLSIFTGFGPSEILIYFAIFCRVSAAISLIPGFGERVVPTRIKLAGALAFTMLLSPMVWNEVANAIEGQTFALVLFTETLIGLAIGIFLRLILVVLQIAGAVAAQSTSLSQIFGAGLGTDPQAAFATLLVVAGLALAASLGLHVHILKAFLLSYDLFPPILVLQSPDLIEWGVGHISAVFSLGFSLAAPFVIASVIYNFGLGVINRAMPQLMVAMVGAPAISLGGLLILFASAPLILSIWVQYLGNGMTLQVQASR